jgi:hydroxypyruvate reductase
VLALVISDVTGDDPTHIASGPCAPDPTTYADAREILDRFAIALPDSIRERLERGARGEIAETPKPGDALFARVENRVIATAHASLVAAATFFQGHGVTPVVLGDSVTGESSEVAKVFGAITRQMHAHGQPAKPPVALISGGETTVTVRGKGRGGRCTEFLLSLAIDLAGLDRAWALACDTDGIDGSEDNAGAILTPDALTRARAAGLKPKELLAGNDGYGFFSALGDLVVTGPTRTNVNDYRVILLPGVAPSGTGS